MNNEHKHNTGKITLCVYIKRQAVKRRTITITTTTKSGLSEQAVTCNKMNKRGGEKKVKIRGNKSLLEVTMGKCRTKDVN